MARRNDTIFQMLIEMPWWVSVIFATFVYISLSLVIPSIEFKSALLASLADQASLQAHWFALFFLVPAPVSLLKSKPVAKRKGRSRNTSILDSLIDSPWWVSATIAMATILLFTFVPEVPLYSIGIPLSCIFLLASAISAIHSTKKKELLDSQGSTESIKRLDLRSFKTTATSPPSTSNATPKTPKEEKSKTVKKQEVRSQSKIQPMPATDTNQKALLKCPRCGSNMVLRKAKKGANAGNQFFGCSSFPKCRYTEN
jgi:restriction system protein